MILCRKRKENWEDNEYIYKWIIKMQMKTD